MAMATATQTGASTPSTPLHRRTVRIIGKIGDSLAPEKETLNGQQMPFISVIDDSIVRLRDQETGRDESHKLDFCYGQEDDISKIFSKEIDPLIPGLFRGLNSTVFSYGSSNSGKTCTMQGTNDKPGLVMMAMNKILSMSDQTGSLVKISCYEVCLDHCYDLLEPKENEVAVLEDKDGQITLRGLAQISVKSISEFLEIFSRRSQQIKRVSNGLNKRHRGLIIWVSTSDNFSNASLLGKMNLVDLAGNEDHRRVSTDNSCVNESVRINKSLFALLNAVLALNANESRVPYRESKLTRILQDSLGGTSQALMIAHLDPLSYQESAYTVNMVTRLCRTGRTSCSYKKDTPRPKLEMRKHQNALLDTTNRFKDIKKCAPSPSPLARKSHTLFSPTMKPKNSGLHSKGRAPGDPVIAMKKRESSDAVTTTVYTMENYVQEICSSDVLVTEKQCILEEDTHKQNEDGVILQNNNGANQVTNSTHTQNDNDIKEIIDGIQDVQLLSQSEDFPHGSSPPISARIRAIRDSLNALTNSPIPFNPKTPDRPGDQICKDILDLKTPEISSDMKFHNNAVKLGTFTPLGTITPLDMFNAHSSGLKVSLVQQYLALLNTGSKEELMKLKGIGEKRAEYILELQEEDPKPFKELSDLANIGLSTKQVYGMLKKTAGDIFTPAEPC
ncbi:hypothetical protein AMTRI_Chr07g80830 [Amborella trichopoda]